MVDAYYQGVFGQRDTLLPITPPQQRYIKPIRAIPKKPKILKPFNFLNRHAVLGALTSFQVGVFGFLVGYGAGGVEGGFIGWIIGLSIGVLGGVLLARP